MPYKAGNSRKYWPDLDRSQRVTRLLEEFREMNTALATALGDTGLQLLPQPSQVRSLAALKPYEDALDALVCAWVGCTFLDASATAYGDAVSAIWVPTARRSFDLTVVGNRSAPTAAGR